MKKIILELTDEEMKNDKRVEFFEKLREKFK